MVLKFKISPIVPLAFTAQFMVVDYSKLNFTYKNNNSKGEFSISGTITLLGDDYDFFKDTVGAIPYRIECYSNGELYFTAKWDHINDTNENKSFKNINLNLTAETTYSDENWKNYDTEYNITELTPETKDLYFIPGYISVERYDDTFTDTRLANNGEVNANLGVANWNIEFIDDLLGVWEPIDMWWEYSGTVNYVRERALGYYVDSLAYTPDEDSGWVYIADVTIEGVDYPEYYRATAATTYTFTPGAEAWTYIENSGTVYNKPAIDYTAVCYRVTDVIEFLIGEMGLATINFDNGGTSTDSFYSFKTITGESLTYGTVTTNLMYNDLLIMNLTDFMPADDDGQNDRPASITNISLKTIHDFFEGLGFEWFIENRAGTLYYILRYREQKSLGSTNPDLKDYFGRNREYLRNGWIKDLPEYYKIINETTCKGLDFVGTEAVLTKVLGTEAERVYVDSKVYVDLNDIAERRTDAYSETDDNNIVIIAAQEEAIKYYVRESAGVRTAVDTNNSELSFSYLVKNIFCTLPDSYIQANGTNYTADAYRLETREKIEFEIPITNIQTDFDVEDYIEFFGDNTELDIISQPALKYTGKFKLKK